MEKLDYTIKKEYRLFICLTCKTGVIKSQIIKHIKEKHPGHYKSEFIVPLEEEIKDLVDSLEEFGRVLGFQEYPWYDPIQYLPELEVFNGFSTNERDNIFFSKTRKEAVKKSKEKRPVECLIQQIFKVPPHQRFVSVYKPLEETTEYQELLNEANHDLCQLVDDQKSSTSKSCSLKGLYMEELSDKYDFIVTLPEDNEDFQIFEVFKLALKFLNSEVEKNMSKLNLAVRRKLQGGEKVFSLVSKETVATYANTVLKLIYFLVKTDKLDLDNLRGKINDTYASTQQEVTLLAGIIAQTLFQILVEKRDDLYDFSRLLGVKVDGSYHPASIIRQQIPHILYFVRLSGAYLALNQLVGDEWINYYDSSVEEGVIRNLHELMAFLDTLGEASVARTIYWKTNEDNVMDYQRLQIRDETVTLTQLKLGIQKAIDLAQQYVKELFAPFHVPEVSLNFGDDINSRVCGKWFISADIEKTYKQLINEKIWSSRFFKDGKWKLDICRKWIDDCDKVGSLILFITQIVYGQPARATELEQMLLRNERNTRRSVFIIDEKVCFMEAYHKARSVTGKDRYIPRFLDRKTSKMFVIFQMFLRQWQQTLINLIHRVTDKPKTSNEQRFYLWVNKDKKLCAENIRDNFAAHFANLIGPKLTTKDYRHVAIAFMEKHTKGQMFDITFHLQAGHSLQTAMIHYANSNLDLVDVDRNTYEAFSKCSDQWQHLLGLIPKKERDDKTLPDNILLEQRLAGMEKNLTEVKNLLTQILDSNTRPIESIEAVEVIPEKKYSSEELVDQSTLIQLKRFFKNESIDFVSDYQKEAVECCLARDRDVIVRMPTGSGKSLIYQLPAYIERDQQIYTVILSPLVSLIEDQITNINRRIPNMASKISREHWDLKKKPTPLLYMHYNDFKFGSKHSEYFESLINSNKLARVVFDEMQTLLLWSPFTYFRQQLPLIRTKPFQLVFLSGSASPVIIDQCIYLFSLDQPRIFYQEAPRPHIKYTVTQIPVNQLMPFANDQEKIIIFVSTKARIKEIQQYQILEGVTKNRISEYHGGMNVTERNENQQKWLGGKKAIMIATTAFSLGIDYPKVRQIYVYGSAYELDNLIQMWGRCARDGLPGYCFYIYANHVSPSSKLERRALSDLEENIQCIRVSLKEIDHGSNCSLMNAQLCSFCEAREKKEGKQKIALGVKRVQLQAFAGLYPPLKRIRNDWTDNSSPLEDNAREISEKKDRIFRIASFIISRFPKDGAITCLICEYRKSSNTYHTSRECPVLSDRCKRCLSLDHLENCTYRITFNDEAHILCGLPFENLDKFVYHLGTECFTNARDRLVPYLMYMYYMEQQMIEKIVDKEFTSASSFFEWLFQMEFSVTHAMELLYELDKNLLQNI